MLFISLIIDPLIIIELCEFNVPLFNFSHPSMSNVDTSKIAVNSTLFPPRTRRQSPVLRLLGMTTNTLYFRQTNTLQSAVRVTNSTPLPHTISLSVGTLSSHLHNSLTLPQASRTPTSKGAPLINRTSWYEGLHARGQLSHLFKNSKFLKSKCVCLLTAFALSKSGLVLAVTHKQLS